MAKDGAVLGTTFIEILPEVSKLKPALTAAERQAQASGKKIEKAVSDSGKAVDLLADRFALVRAEQQKLDAAIASGSTRSVGQLTRVTASVESLRVEMARAAAAGRTLTSSQVRDFALIQAQQQKNIAQVRDVRDMQAQLRNQTSNSGLAFANMGQMLGVAGNGLGMFAARATMALLAAQALKRVILSTTPEDVKRNSWIGKLETFTLSGAIRDLIRNYSDAIANMPMMIGGAMGGTAGLAAAMVRSGQAGFGSAKFGLENWSRYGRGAEPHGPSVPSGFDPKIAEAFTRTQKERLLLLDLENAKLSENAAAMRAVQAELDNLARQEMLAAGYTEANIGAIIAKTQANRKLAEAVRERIAAEQRSDRIENTFMSAFGKIRETTRGMFAATPLPSVPSVTIDMTPVMARNVAIVRNGMSQIVEIVRSSATVMESSLSQGFFSAITGNVDGVKSAFRGMLNDMLKEITNFLARQAVQMLLSYFGGMWDSRVVAGRPYTNINVTPGRANGGIVQGGWQALTPFANGGVVTRPTIGLVGEGKYNEAVVPLPDGNSIPVSFQGRDKQIVENHITFMLAHDFIAGLRPAVQPTAKEIVMKIGADVFANGAMRDIIRGA